MNVEELIIYKQYTELIYYTEDILKKYPKVERYSLITDIKNTTYEGIKCIIYAYRTYKKEEKIKFLFKLDSELKFLKVLIRISYKINIYLVKIILLGAKKYSMYAIY